MSETVPFEVGDVVKAGDGSFAGTVIDIDDGFCIVENRDGESKAFYHKDLQETA